MEKKSEKLSDFEIVQVDEDNGVVLLEDKEIGLQAKVSIGKKKFAEAKVTGPYQIRITYADGSTQLKQFLK
jgi:hypothetical protein